MKISKNKNEITLEIHPENEEQERILRELFLKNRVLVSLVRAYIKEDLKLEITKFDRLIIRFEAGDKWEEFRNRIQKERI